MSEVAQTQPDALAAGSSADGAKDAKKSPGWLKLLFRFPVAAATLPNLDKKELIDRLALNSPELVGELLTLVQGQITAEVGRQTRLDAKATSLLTAAGLSLTVTTGFAGTILTHPKLLEGWRAWIGGAAGIAFLFAVICGLIASLHAVAALRVVGGYRAGNEEALFDRKLLRRANDMPNLDDEATDEEKRVFGLMTYRKHMIPHYWEILQAQRGVHDTKSRLVDVGQLFFLAFLAACLVVCVLGIVGVLSSA